MKLTGLLLCFACLAGLAGASEVAVLEDGTRIAAERHENAGDKIRLYTSEGVEEVAADAVREFAPGPAPVELEMPPALAPQVPAGLQPTSQAARKPPDPHALIRAAARKHRVPAAMVKSIMAAESAFNPDAVSPKGALGLMQVMPATAQQFGLDASVPEQNVDAGTRYLRFLIDKYQRYRNWLRRVIAAYNAGPAAVDKYRGVPPYPETRVYVARVLAFLKVFRRDPM